MRINLTSGDCLNDILSAKNTNELFVSFGEAMITGTYTARLFSDDFILERALTHGVSVEEYKRKLHGFLTFLEDVNFYDEVVLWFGDEPFCRANRSVLLNTLKEYGFKGKIILNIVNEETGDILEILPCSLN